MIDNEEKYSVPAQSSASPSSSDSGADRLISAKEAGRVLSRSRTFLRSLRVRGELKPVAIGGHCIAYRMRDVQSYMNALPIKPVSVALADNVTHRRAAPPS